MNVKYIGLMILALSLTACSENKLDKPVARAGSTYITQPEVAYQLSRFDSEARSSITQDKQQYQRLVESMALTKVMAQKQLSAMTADKILQFEISMQAYREQMLAKFYIEENFERQVPDRKTVEAYYEAHADEFGSRKQYSVNIHYVPDNCSLKDEYLAKVLNQDKYERLKKSGCQFVASPERFDRAALLLKYPSLKGDIALHKAYWTSENGMPVLIYVAGISEIAARPLSEVTSEIRKRLAPMYLKKSLEKERVQLRKEIEFFE